MVSLAAPVQSEAEDKPLTLLCLNIGKADCMLLTYGNSHYLIDAGYEQNWPALETALNQYGITYLDGVFLTHCHEDHQGGLMPLAESEIGVGAWYAPSIYSAQYPATHPILLAAARRGEQPAWLEAGMEISVEGDGAFSVLGPLTVNTENENNNSLVMRFSCPAGSILLAGDMKEEEEEALLSAKAFTPCTLLKAGHHGDNKATGKLLLKAVQPQAAVIPTNSGEEPDTPAASTLKRLRNAGCEVYVTQDADDAILFTLKDGQIASVQNVQWANVPARITGVEMDIELMDDTLTILNAGSDSLTFSGYQLYSTKGNELLALPDFVLAPGETYVVGSRSTDAAVDCRWDIKRVWNKKKRDAGILYDAYGRVIACTDNGVEE